MDPQILEEFIQKRLEAFRDRTAMWGSDEAVELCAIQLLEVWQLQRGVSDDPRLVLDLYIRELGKRRIYNQPLSSTIEKHDFGPVLYEVIQCVWSELKALVQARPSTPWFGVDFDGTLAYQSSAHAPTELGEPIPEMVDQVRELLRRGYAVRIFTARLSVLMTPEGVPDRNVAEVRAAIEAWCEKHIGQKLPVTNIKDHGLIELWDDRAIGVIPNTGVRKQLSRLDLDRRHSS